MKASDSLPSAALEAEPGGGGGGGGRWSLVAGRFQGLAAGRVASVAQIMPRASRN